MTLLSSILTRLVELSLELAAIYFPSGENAMQFIQPIVKIFILRIKKLVKNVYVI